MAPHIKVDVPEGIIYARFYIRLTNPYQVRKKFKTTYNIYYNNNSRNDTIYILKTFGYFARVLKFFCF